MPHPNEIQLAATGVIVKTTPDFDALMYEARECLTAKHVEVIWTQYTRQREILDSK
ncbi:hypothetical protein UFOVP1537_11 [uncultured Caudovirales phage]|uniref:Uncharacterized protein n=2 Tax=root TaxID=1 RepID=A0A6J5QJ54_9CAUD|nr:hypothetical protein UFOVP825_29 [uncultured Caudovirales phage]CAB4171192.1 hypothetical protein UFOVP915_11 [uncultured Caudovirales phage]CAB4177211.1 hypothetical protein UFOVP1000_28 [uncultured Caudovirales phage]CAB4182457.1 hypothetical protein UFOVP1092_3 [uncultured Caudovirales phage]CAB4187302.1 hypothetical protein UFOVP1152_7 [uncultured Caudovirales phage]